MSYSVLKRIIDVVVSGVACLLLLPLWVGLAVAIRYDSEGSPIFSQLRIGKSGQTFHILKFRSMVKNAPSLGSWQTAQNDPRITRVGKFIRATSLDEMPQLWNVLRGDMSLIGPRPQVPASQSQCTPIEWELRHRVRPGLTGLAQVNGRSALSDEEQLRYDLAYASSVSWRGDLDILIKTLFVVFKRHGTN